MISLLRRPASLACHFEADRDIAEDFLLHLLLCHFYQLILEVIEHKISRFSR